MLISSWLHVVRREACDMETYALALDALIAFISDMNDYMTQNKVADTRNEGEWIHTTASSFYSFSLQYS